jgi:hypothetical protein
MKMAPKPRLRLSSHATVKSLKIRKEGPEDRRFLAVDLRLLFNDVDRMICDYFDPALSDFLFRAESGGLVVRNEWMSPVQYHLTERGCLMEIDHDIFRGCEVRSFAVAPVAGGRICLGCSVSFFPGAQDVTHLARLVESQAMVTIASHLDLFTV